jgi:enterochelin esterase-like enzyme
LQHGYGENETGWIYQGHAGRIADQLLHRGGMKEMLIVMANGMTQGAGRIRERMLFPKVILEDLIPFIEKTYNVYTDKWHRAMAGLSMGSYQTSIVTMSHPELFGYAGVFSGFMRSPWGGEKEPHLSILDDKDAFNAAYRVFYRAMGTEDTYFASFAADDEMLEGRGLNILRQTFPGGHDWGVWRRCIHAFLPLLFREA